MSGDRAWAAASSRTVLALQAEVDAYRQLYNTWRPHEALDFGVPLGHYLAEPTPEPNLSEPETVQIS